MNLGLPLDHVGVAVRTLDEGSRAYQLLGLTVDGDDEEVLTQGVRVRTLQGGGSLVELLEPTSQGSPLVKFLEKRGPGVHHLAFRVDDLDAEITRLQLEGAPFIDSEPKPGRGGSRVVFLHPSWAGGVLIELVEHP